MHLIQQMPFQSAQSPTAMFKPLRQQVFSSHIKKANALHWLFSSYSVVFVYYLKTIIRVWGITLLQKGFPQWLDRHTAANSDMNIIQ